MRQEIEFGRVVVNETTDTFLEYGSKTEDHRTVPVPAPVMDAWSRTSRHTARRGTGTRSCS
jgi:hypothetical protein